MDGGVVVERGHPRDVLLLNPQMQRTKDFLSKVQKFVYEPVEQAIVIPKGSKLGPAVQAAMKELVENGTYAKILKKWGIEHVAYDSPDKVKLLTGPSQAP